MPPRLEPYREVLERDPVLYIDLIEALRRGIGQVLYADEGACLVGFPHGDRPVTEFTTLCADLAAARRVFARLPWERDILFAVHEPPTLSYVREHHPVLPFLGERFYQAAYLNQEPPSIPSSPFSVLPLTPNSLEDVAQIHPSEEKEYLLDRLNAGVMLGALEGETLAGIIGIHGEGSMGLLEVRPDYRRRGVAALLEAHMICRLLAQGETPYGSVRTDNVPSLALQRSLGMTFSSPSFHWLTNH